MKHFNNPELRVFLGGYLPFTRNIEREWILSTEEEIKKRRAFHFAIETHPEGEMIGTLGLHDVDWLSRSCTLGIAIYQPKNWGKGLGSDAMRILIDFGWNHLNLRRIDLSVHSFNERAIKAYEKLGFARYGTAHQKSYMGGKYVDTHYMELFRETRE